MHYGTCTAACLHKGAGLAHDQIARAYRQPLTRWPSNGRVAAMQQLYGRKLFYCNLFPSAFVSDLICFWQLAGSFAHEDGIISSILHLTHLRELYLTIHVDPEEFAHEAIAPYTTSLARLSALTALTELMLDLSRCYQYGGDNLQMMQLAGDDHEAWTEVREAHRTSLLSALRAMPQLQHLDCATLWLHPSEAATLTALTSLQLGGLMPPPYGGSRPTSPLPPRLADLCLDSAVSPRLLASLQIPSTLTSLRSCRLRFGMSDVNQETCQLLPETVAAVGPAVQRMKALRPNGSLGRFWLLTADGAARPLLPRAGVPDGHAEWLGQLGALDGVDLALRGFALQVEDVCCLAQTLGKVQVSPPWGLFCTQ